VIGETVITQAAVPQIGIIIAEYEDEYGCEIEGCRGHLVKIAWPEGVDDPAWTEINQRIHNDPDGDGLLDEYIEAAADDLGLEVTAACTAGLLASNVTDWRIGGIR
jgi:hypothetical protein